MRFFDQHIRKAIALKQRRIHNDILRAIDDGECVILVLLDLSAAFDTVDHHILITRLKHRFGITGKALGWIQPYLSGRTQFVKIGTERSSNRNLLCGVPQVPSCIPCTPRLSQTSWVNTTWTIIFMLMITKFICLSRRVLLANQLGQTAHWVMHSRC